MTHPTQPLSPEALLEHREWLRAIARSLVGDENAVDDIEQRTWLTVLRNRRPVASVRGWLRRVVHSAVIDEHRSTSRRRAREEDAARPGTLPPTDHLSMQLEAQRAVAQAVAGLPEPYRTTVLLRYIEELSVADVAARMSVPVKTVQTRLRRAHALLRDALDREFGDRRAWALMLLPLSTTRSPVPVGALTTGAVLMAGKTKAVVAAVVLAALGAGAVWWTTDTSPSPVRGLVAEDGPATLAVTPTTAKEPAKLDDVAVEADAGLSVGVDVVDSASKPVAGARVELAQVVTNVAKASDENWFLGVGTAPEKLSAQQAGSTSAGGAADVAGLAAGEWRLRVVAVGFALHEERVSVSVNAPRRRVVLHPASVLAGRVLRADGTPAGGVEVVVGGQRAAVDKSGLYRFDALARGIHAVSVRRADGVVQEMFKIAVPEVSQLDLHLRGGCVLRGRVVDDATGEPLAGARVLFRSTNYGELPHMLGSAAQAVSDEDGRFGWTDLPAGIADMLTAFLDGFMPSRNGRDRLPPGLRLAPGLEPTVEVRMARGAVVRGRVLFPDSTPVEGAVVDVLTRGDRVAIAMSAAFTTGADGGFHTLAQPGKALVRVRGPRLKQRDLPADPYTAVRDDAIPTACRVTVAPSGETTIDIVVDQIAASAPPAAAVAPEDAKVDVERTKTISGRIVDASDAGVSGAELSVSQSKWANAGPVAAASAPDGAFVVTGLAAGDVYIVARAAGFASRRMTVAAGSESVSIRLERTLSISGTVVDAASGEPLAGVPLHAEFSVYHEGGVLYRETASDASGRFVLSDLAPDTFRICVGSMGERYPWGAGDFNLTSVDGVKAGAVGVRVPVTRGLAIAGRVVDDQGRPVGGGIIDAMGEQRPGMQQPESARRARVLADGTFRLPGLAPGAYDLALGEDARDPGPVRLEHVEAGTSGVVVSTQVLLPIEGRLLLEDGSPFPRGPGRVRVQWTSPDGTPNLRDLPAMWGTDGRYRTNRLDPACTYDLVVSDVPGRLGAVVRGVRAGTRDLDIVVREGVRIQGRVVDASGNAVPADVHVSANAVDAHVSGRLPSLPGDYGFAKTGADGRFEIRGLGDRGYQLRAGGHPSVFLETESPVVVTPGASNVELRVERGVSISGRVVDGKGAALKAGMVQVKHELVQLDAAGGFAIHALAPGSYPLVMHIGERIVDLGVVQAPGEGLVLVVPEK